MQDECDVTHVLIVILQGKIDDDINFHFNANKCQAKVILDQILEDKILFLAQSCPVWPQK